MIRDNLRAVEERISSVCKRLGRNPQEIVLIGVTKYADIAQIKEALQAGLTHIAENKVQQAQERLPALDGVIPSLTKHMIGHLQSNKAKQALQLFDLIHSVDSLKLAQEIDKQAQKLNKEAQILVQVNTSGEKSKSGAESAQAVSLVQQISVLPHVKALGLMTMAPLTEDQNIVRQAFRELKKIFDQIATMSLSRVEMRYLSMGMSQDYEIALEEGANMIRIGSAIFK
ncbi:MAG: YggS family pyridoxal phosphate-dependent enzyme [Candidatus Omnitrophota bacterium]|nr:YggS family pyridoxal phosphate-dependent enzyme [Candidatus Omnitrophota bacterium]